MNTTQPTYRIVNQETGKQLRPYQTTADRDAFLNASAFKAVAQYRDSVSMNLHTTYVVPA